MIGSASWRCNLISISIRLTLHWLIKRARRWIFDGLGIVLRLIKECFPFRVAAARKTANLSSAGGVERDITVYSQGTGLW